MSAVWAPHRERVRLVSGDAAHEMTRDERGWWHGSASVAVGSDYAFLLDDDETPLPDPR